MKLFEILFDLIFGADASVKNKSLSVKESDFDNQAIKANNLTISMNKLLIAANTSNNIELRLQNLRKVRLQLNELKSITHKHPEIAITRLEGFEASILSVEKETSEMSTSNDVKRNIENNRFSDSEVNIALKHIHGKIKVINESIDIARRSKNQETTKSRLDVARRILVEAKKEALQYSINVDGFYEAEREIERIVNAINQGTPKIIEGMQQIEPDPMFSTPSRNLLKEATALKKDKKYIEACNKLREAYNAEGADTLMIEERLRLAMYLQLAGKNDEGWADLNRLLKKYNDPFTNATILKQIQIFLKKENNVDAKNPKRIIEKIQINESMPLSESVLKVWNDNKDIIFGLEFHATLKLHTPLAVLLKNGHIHTEINTPTPKFTNELNHGVWLPKTKSFRELGLNVDEFPEGTVTSDIGLVNPSDYLPFLIDIRKIVEANEEIQTRTEKLKKIILIDSNYQTFVEKHGGINKIIQQFFPRFIDTLPNISDDTVIELNNLGILTPNDLANASSETLLRVKGIGQVKLSLIREYTSGIIDNRNSDRIDLVTSKKSLWDTSGAIEL